MSPSDASHDTPDDEEVARALAEARRLLGLDGPPRTILVDGHPYRLIHDPIAGDTPASAAALWADAVHLVVTWLRQHPAVAAEVSTCPLPSLPEVQALPFTTQALIYAGLSLEHYAVTHGHPTTGSPPRAPTPRKEHPAR